MADTALPDEIISEILSPALKVPDDSFTNASSATFASYTESTSAYLLVCKSWLRVSTPLLYNVVILRSKAQAQALENALSKNADLGRFIKKLRVEGGYGPSMHTILKASPNITDLFLSLEIWSPDKTDGLCKGLPLISPAGLILRDTSSESYSNAPHNKMVRSLVDTLVAVIPKWEHLTTFGCPSDCSTVKAQRVIAALAESKRIRVLLAHDVDGAEWTYKALGPTCPISLVRVRSVKDKYTRTPADAKLASLLKFADPEPETYTAATPPASESLIIAPSLNPSFVPMENVAVEIQDAIWSRILYFAMLCPERADTLLKKGYVGSLAMIPRMHFLSVCKAFLRVGLAHFYSIVILRPGNITQAQTTFTRNSPHELPIQTVVVQQGIAEISTKLFSSITCCAGPFLVDLRVSLCRTYSPVDLSFSSLRLLRRFHWTGDVWFDEHDLDVEALPLLETLIVRKASASFLAVLTKTKLPCLRILDIDHKAAGLAALLQAHGRKLQKLSLAPVDLTANTLDLCPHVLELTLNFLPFAAQPPPRNAFKTRSPLDALTKITFNLDWPWQRNKKTKMSTDWDAFFAAFKPQESLPGLREIMFTPFIWPTNEREIAKSCWVPWAEDLLKRFNVHLVDENGKKWRPRLKVGGR
ncbi:hypothetical protein C8F01DRAFT_1171295 [Mycena amicta]|nr:hypothetical protein C8F01DRAFT_1171295 [Mycena amicta]